MAKQFLFKFILSILFLVLPELGISKGLPTEFPINDSLSQIAKEEDRNLILEISKNYSLKSDIDKIECFNRAVEEIQLAPLWSWYNQILLDFLPSLIEESENIFRLNQSLATAFNNRAFRKNHIGDVSGALTDHKKAINLQKEILDSVGLANSYVNLGAIYTKTANSKEAIICFKLASDLFRVLNDYKGLSIALNNLAYVYKKCGLIKEALLVYKESLTIKEQQNDQKGIATSLINIASILYSQGDEETALAYYKKSIKIRKSEKLHHKLSLPLNNVGQIFLANGQLNLARDMFKQAMSIDSIENNRKGLSISWSNMALLEEKENNFEKALEANLNSLSIKKSISYKAGMSISYLNLGELYFKNYDLNKADLYADSALQLSQELGYPQNIVESTALASKIAYQLNDFKKCADLQILQQLMKDSIHSLETKQSIINFEVNYEIEKARSADSVVYSVQRKIDRLVLSQQESEIGFNKMKSKIYIVLSFTLIILLLVVFRRYKINKEKNELIENQNKNLEIKSIQVEEQNREINESIKYAESIQMGLLTSEVYWSQLFDDFFIYFKPKSSVSGDFYWLFKNEHGDKIWLVGDATGHGVAGAFTSIIGCTLLNEIIVERKIYDCGEILNELRKGIIKILLGRDGNIVNDIGMDLSICKLSPDLTLEFAGAQNSAYIVRNSELIELKASKQPIGLYPKSSPFISSKIKVLKNDQIYMFTDGYPDQFGGKSGKKLKNKNFKAILVDGAANSMIDQKGYLQNYFHEWKGKNEQVDDVCVVGVKV